MEKGHALGLIFSLFDKILYGLFYDFEIINFLMNIYIPIQFLNAEMILSFN